MMYKKILIVVFIFLIITGLVLSFKLYKSSDGKYQFIYPRSWHVEEMNTSPYIFHGLVISPKKITNDEVGYNGGGFVQISSETLEKKYNSVDEYIKDLDIAEYNTYFNFQVKGYDLYKIKVKYPNSNNKLDNLSFKLGAYVIQSFFRINNNEKIYTTKGYAYFAKFNVFPKLNFSYPSDWVVNEKGQNNNGAYDNITASKKGYVVVIDQRLMTGAGGCRFKDSPIPPWPARDLTMVEYKEIDSNLGYLRYFKVPLGEFDTPGTPQNTYSFCVKQNENYQVLSIGSVTIETPSTLDNAVFTEALNIVKSIKKVE